MIKKITLINLFIAAIAVNSFAQSADIPEPPTAKSNNEILTIVDQKAEPGYDWIAYLSSNLVYPMEAREAEIEGRVTVKFIIEKDGRLTNIKIIRGGQLGYGIPEECIRLLKNAPKWIPGKVQGKPVRSYYSLPFTFKLDKPKEPKQGGY